MAARSPEDVHPEYDLPTPENLDEWSDEQLEAFREAKDAELEVEVEETQRELSEEARAARDVLLGLGRSTAVVDLAELDDRLDESVEIEVQTEVSGQAERRLNEVTDLEGLDGKLEAILDVIEEVVVGPEGYNDREAWRDLWEARGTGFLTDCMDLLLKPAHEEVRRAGSFRDDD